MKFSVRTALTVGLIGIFLPFLGAKCNEKLEKKIESALNKAEEGEACETKDDCNSSRCKLLDCLNGACTDNGSYYKQGTVAVFQEVGDCNENVCDGLGGMHKRFLDEALPLSGIYDCFDNKCIKLPDGTGVPGKANKAAGDWCGNCYQCDGDGGCEPIKGGCIPVPGPCKSDQQCGEMSVCLQGACKPATCADGIKNNDESDVDCGFDCIPCDSGKLCHINEDCLNDNCVGGYCVD